MREGGELRFRQLPTLLLALKRGWGGQPQDVDIWLLSKT